MHFRPTTFFLLRNMKSTHALRRARRDPREATRDERGPRPVRGHGQNVAPKARAERRGARPRDRGDGHARGRGTRAPRGGVSRQRAPRRPARYRLHAHDRARPPTQAAPSPPREREFASPPRAPVVARSSSHAPSSGEWVTTLLSEATGLGAEAVLFQVDAGRVHHAGVVGIAFRAAAVTAGRGGDVEPVPFAHFCFDLLRDHGES